MSDDTPAEESPGVEAPTATPEPAAVGTPATETPAAPAEVPATEAPVDETPTVEATAPDGPPVVAADPAPVPAGTTPAAAPEAVPVGGAAAAPSSRKGIFVPAWAAAIVLVLVVAAVGFGIGRWTADDSSTNSSAIANNGGVVPQSPNGNGNNGGGNGNSGGQTTPQTPSTGTAFLGVGPQATNGGVEIASIGANSPAARAGLQEGDVITAIDDTSITTETALRAAIQSHDPGDSVTVHYTRDGKAATVRVTLGTQSQ